MSGRVEGRSILLTGGGSGIGRALCIGLAKEGAEVTIFDLNGEAAKAVAAEIVAAGGKAASVAGNVTVRADVQRAMATASEKFGKLDVMFALAGMIKPQKFLDIDEASFRTHQEIMGLGTLLCFQEAAKQMIKQGHGGKLIFTSSIAGRQGYANFGSYCYSKFGLTGLGQSAAHEFAEHHITVNGFAPGVVSTPLWAQLDKDMAAAGMAEKEGDAWEAFSMANLVGKKCAPEDLVGTALFLASGDSEFSTGQIVMIEGGMTLV
jgi:meso-butanediol dehydrogenase / (S,S)-butanediol dehydrogenase / diacetyl reductase